MKTSPSFLIAKTIVALLLISSGALVCSSVFASSATTLSLTVSGSLAVDIVDASYVTVGSPAVTMSGTTYNNRETTTSTGTLGAAAQQILITNPTATAAWSVAIAATGGTTTVWTTGSINMDYNDGSAGTDDNDSVSDADSVGGRLTVNPSGATLAGTGGSSTSNISLGSSTSFKEGTTASATIATSTTAAAPGEWTIQGVALTQIVPAKQLPGAYTIGLTLTIS